jgi:hypothetical protein
MPHYVIPGKLIKEQSYSIFTVFITLNSSYLIKR